MSIRIGSAVQRALKQVVQGMAQRQSGLFVPPDYIAGKHYGGFSGYEEWIQACIREACQSARGVGQDELPEISALCIWGGSEGIHFALQKHAETMLAFERLAEALAAANGRSGGLSEKIIDQIRRVDGQRERGTLLVIALNGPKLEETGDLMASVSAWRPADVEEAKAVPKQTYGRVYG